MRLCLSFCRPISTYYQAFSMTELVDTTKVDDRARWQNQFLVDRPRHYLRHMKPSSALTHPLLGVCLFWDLYHTQTCQVLF